MSWEHLTCSTHQRPMDLVDLAGEHPEQVAHFRCPVDGEEATLAEAEAMDTSHLPVLEVPEPEGLTPIPEDS